VATVDPLVIPDFDIFELCDKAMVNRFQFVLDSKVVPVFPGTAQRAFALARRAYGIDSDRPPLPVAAVRRTGTEIAPSRNFLTKRMTVNYPKSDIIDPEKPVVDMVNVFQAPQAVDFAYKFDLWAASRRQLNEAMQQYLELFILDKTYVIVPVPWGNFYFMLKTQNPTDETEEAPADKEREYKMSAALSLEAYVFRGIETKKVITKVHSVFEELF
jgi:hypothetical protein